jgi:hypothetical protein
VRRWTLSYTEEKVLDHMLSEYRVARKARTEAKRLIAASKNARYPYEAHAAHELLAASQETIRLCAEVVHLIRRQGGGGF